MFVPPKVSLKYLPTSRDNEPEHTRLETACRNLNCVFPAKCRPENDLWIVISTSQQRFTAVSESISAEHNTDRKKLSKGSIPPVQFLSERGSSCHYQREDRGLAVETLQPLEWK